jgi:hypothetical protein
MTKFQANPARILGVAYAGSSPAPPPSQLNLTSALSDFGGAQQKHNICLMFC